MCKVVDGVVAVDKEDKGLSRDGGDVVGEVACASVFFLLFGGRRAKDEVELAVKEVFKGGVRTRGAEVNLGIGFAEGTHGAGIEGIEGVGATDVGEVAAQVVLRFGLNPFGAGVFAEGLVEMPRNGVGELAIAFDRVPPMERTGDEDKHRAYTDKEGDLSCTEALDQF